MLARDAVATDTKERGHLALNEMAYSIIPEAVGIAELHCDRRRVFDVKEHAWRLPTQRVPSPKISQEPAPAPVAEEEAAAEEAQEEESEEEAPGPLAPGELPTVAHLERLLKSTGKKLLVADIVQALGVRREDTAQWTAFKVSGQERGGGRRLDDVSCSVSMVMVEHSTLGDADRSCGVMGDLWIPVLLALLVEWQLPP